MIAADEKTRQQVERVRRALGPAAKMQFAPPEPDMARILILDDDPVDLRALKRALSRIEYGVHLYEAATAKEALYAVQAATFDLAVLDYDLQCGNSHEVFHAFRAARTPVIMVTGAGNERLAASLLGEGAAAYLIKDVAGTYLNVLPRTVKQVFERGRLERERDWLLDRMAEMLETINTLRGLIPVCSVCRKIRDGNGQWENFEVMVARTYAAEFTHGLCPSCLEQELRNAGLA